MLGAQDYVAATAATVTHTPLINCARLTKFKQLHGPRPNFVGSFLTPDVLTYPQIYSAQLAYTTRWGYKCDVCTLSLRRPSCVEWIFSKINPFFLKFQTNCPVNNKLNVNYLIFVQICIFNFRLFFAISFLDTCTVTVFHLSKYKNANYGIYTMLIIQDQALVTPFSGNIPHNYVVK